MNRLNTRPRNTFCPSIHVTYDEHNGYVVTVIDHFHRKSETVHPTAQAAIDFTYNFPSDYPVFINIQVAP